jgi:serralysin
MGSPFVQFDADGTLIDADARKTARAVSPNYVPLANVALPGNPIAAPADTVLPGSLSGTEENDLIAVNLIAGQTYSFAYRGTAVGGIEDPYLALLAPDRTIAVAEDDDGGAGRSALITYTPTLTNTYYLYATSWVTLDTGDPSLDTGNYTIDIWSPDPAKDAPSTFAGAETITAGTQFGYLDNGTDIDTYRIDATAGQFYSLTYAGGIAGPAELGDPMPGENIGVLNLFDAEGNQIASAVNYETGLSFLAEQSGTYYVQVSGLSPELTGGYTLDLAAINPADYDPLDSIDWENAANVPFVDVGGVPTAYVYFAPAGENFGELADDGVTPMTTFGWEQFQIDGVMNALTEYEKLLGVNYEITTDASQATFRLLTTESEEYGAYFYPRDPVYGTQQGIAAFNLLSGGFTLPESLQPGGYSYGVILHEFGHAHGLAHPHDNGGGSDVMLGVTGADSLGVYDLNQGVYTVMSYNDGWATNPDGALDFTRATVGYGWVGSPSAFDIAQLQERYGTHPLNSGNTVYALDDANGAGTYYQTIWDTGGTDTIRYDGARDTRIDLLAATLDYSPTGGGVVSYVDDIYGGYTIANGVVIENATGGAGNDVLIGNAAINVLTGNAGADTLMGRDGSDILRGGEGDDRLVGGQGLDLMFGGAGNDVFVIEQDVPDGGWFDLSVDIIGDFARGDTIDLSGIDANLRQAGDQAFTIASGFQLFPRIGTISSMSFGNLASAELMLGFSVDAEQRASIGSGGLTVLLGENSGDRIADFALLVLGTSSVGVPNIVV